MIWDTLTDQAIGLIVGCVIGFVLGIAVSAKREAHEAIETINEYIRECKAKEEHKSDG